MKKIISILFAIFSCSSNATDISYVVQVLEPLGGNIERPENWYYTEDHNSQSWMWTISRENSENGQSYDVGMRIQAGPNIEKLTGKSPKQFILDLKEKNSRKADKVVDHCEETNQGLFHRVCLETHEGPFHILYSLFWSERMDMIVITTAGAPKEEWTTYKDIFGRMAAFELIDMSRFSDE